LSNQADYQTDLKTRLDNIWDQIIDAGGSKSKIKIIAVTKTVDTNQIDAARQCGLKDFGENYAQEIIKKDEILENSTSFNWHFIGGIQRNKVKQVANLVSVWHSVDRESIITEISKRAPGSKIFIQVNTTGEPQKSGCDPSDVSLLLSRARQNGLIVEGLMTVGSTTQKDQRPYFEKLATLGSKTGLSNLSMGMSNDFVEAVQLGGNHLRIGTAIFGQRL